MGETITIRTPSSTEVIKVIEQGPQGPVGPKGDPGDVAGLPLTTTGDTLYRAANSTNARLPIGTSGQVLKVANGIPAWANESGAVTSVNGQTGVVTVAALNHTHEAADVFFQGLELLDAGNANTNGVYVYGGVFGGKGIYYKDKDSFIYWDGAAWMVSYNSDDIYSSAQNTTTPWQVTSWSVEVGQTSPAPSSWDRLTGDQWEAVVGQRINPTLRGTAAGKNVGTGADDVSAGNHTHAAATTSVAGFLSAADKTKLDGLGSASSKNAPATGNASSSEVVLGNDSRLSDSRTPTAHTHELSSLSSTGAGADDILVSDGDGTASWRNLSTFIGENVGPADIGAAQASHTHGALTNDGKIGATANLPLRTGTNGVIEAGSFGTSAGSFCEGNDARLSDDRDPNLHAASHLPEGADEIFDQSLDKSDSVEFATVGIGDAPTGSERKFHQHGGKFTVESNSGSFGQFQVVNPSAGEVSFVLVSEGTPAENGWVDAPTSANIWAFGTGSYGNDPTTFVIGNNEGGSVFHVLPDGKVGLGSGNNDPAEALDVDGNIALRDIDNGFTATFDVQEQLSDDVVLTIPDQSGTLAVVTDIPTTAGDVGAVAAGAITTSGLTQATARILGRTTASTGAVEEITIGSGLSLSAGELSATGGSGGGEVRSDFVSPYTYTGLADAGTSESTASWLIRRSEFDAGGSFVATLTASAVQWANRLTASYS